MVEPKVNIINPASQDIVSEIEELLALIKTGQLFAVQRWINEGRPLRLPPDVTIERGERLCPLAEAVESGFHSLVEVLVRAGGWSQDVLDEVFELATSSHRQDIAHLLRDNGATMAALDFEEVCRSMNQAFMEEALRNGADPKRENAFARALIRFGAARPLLNFYRRMRGEFPVLDGQAALALTIAARNKKARVAAMLAWAGADPFRMVPGNEDDDDWDFGDGSDRYTTTAAEAAVGSGSVEIVKSLKLKPTAEQAREVLERIAWNPSRELVRAIIAALPDGNLNVSERGSCPALESLVRKRRPISFYGSSPEKEIERTVECIDDLLAAGARWNPPPEEIRDVRRCLLEHDDLYIVRIVRLLLYTPGACDPAHVLDLCRTPTIRQRIHSGDAELRLELAELAQKERDKNSPAIAV